ncbi:malate dehydrogenase [Gloeophyllum trabeum ATCC 11539]|uniref:Malate dehydrogenase n=1 Tax=Gloeophyllum trabeum (strain ATCC 11539 / FP-39264 / Madison 617) TaxID=670483 RepID=S7PXC3_GLOTA|nr:malate dehydrogenase [Gloeophyllum trabeum ATCC 11539]EPQ52251.1 malate dehydrogenase [Gloeophyllum trabeum ATCC 11539]
MTLLKFALTVLAVTSGVFAAPGQYAACDISSATLPLPSNQSQLTPATGAPSFIALGVGVQNYTCSSAGTYTNIGAVAEVFDISCLYNMPAFASIQNTAYTAWEHAPASLTAQEVIAMLSNMPVKVVLGQHYFVPNPITGSGTSPKWDFTSAAYAGNPNAFAIGARTGNLASPDGAANVDWLQLKVVQGNLATSVYRVNTVGGQLPGSCSPSDTTVHSVKYTSKYYFFGGSIKQ